MTEPGQSWNADVGKDLGPYHILEKVGSGGMGTVYVAEQREPFRRRVAIKVMNPGFDSKEVLTRFELEHRVLALMDHPNIARLYDAGTTPDGRPYFVMEYVAGLPLIAFCDRHALGLEARLKLFVDICHAVQHAHQKGIIHRDLKPSNILVLMQEDRPLAKIIDFGVAKATGGGLVERTLHTQFGQVVGTPAYMSPEQFRMDVEAVDTRTDVYSLGALLYELVCGDMPLGADSLGKISLAEFHRRLMETDPLRPSERVAALDHHTLQTTAGHRALHGPALARRLKGDLDWIAMKALSRERTRRYASASELAADVERHLHNEPVLAGPPSLAYRLRKVAQRHRVLTASALAALLALLVGLGVSIVLWQRAEDARRAERRAREATAVQEQAAQEGYRQAKAYASDLEVQKAETQRRFDEAQQHLGLFHWEAGDRRLADGEFRGAAKNYAEALALGVESIDDKMLISHDLYGKDQVLRARLSRALACLPRGPAEIGCDVHRACASPSGRRIAVTTLEGPVVVWEPPDTRPTHVIETEEGATRLLFLDEDTIVFVAGLWMTGVRVGQIDLVRGSVTRRRVLDDTFSYDTTLVRQRGLIAIGQGNGRVRLIDARTFEDAALMTPQAVIDGETDRSKRRDRSVDAVAVDASGRWLATLGRDRALRLWDLTHFKLTAEVEVPWGAAGLTFLSQRRLLIWASKGLFTFDFDAVTPAPVELYEGVVLDAVARPNGRVFVLGAAGYGETDGLGPLSLRSFPPEVSWLSIPGLRPPIPSIASAGGRWIPCVVRNVLVLFDGETGSPIAKAGHLVVNPRIAAMSSDGSAMLVAGNHFRWQDFPALPPEVQRFRGEGGRYVLAGHDPAVAVAAAAIDGEGRRAATVDRNGGLRVFGGPDWTLLESAQVASEARDLEMSQDGRSVYVLGVDGSLELRDATSPSKVLVRRELGSARGKGVLRGDPGGGCWVGDAEGVIERFQADTLNPDHRLRLERGPVQTISVSRDGHWLAASDPAGHVGFWPDLDEDRYWSYTEASLASGALSEQGDLFALALEGGDLHVLDTASRSIVCRMSTSDRGLTAAAFQTGDHVVVAAGFDSGAFRVELAPRLAAGRYEDHRAEIVALAANPARPRYASLDESGRLVRRDLTGREPPRTLSLPGSARTRWAGTGLHYTPDGQRLVAETPEGGLVVLQDEDLSSAGPAGEVREPAAAYFDVTGTGGEAALFVVRGSVLERASLTDLAHATQIATDVPNGACHLVAGTDGSWCAVGFTDGTVRLWAMPSGELRWTWRHPDTQAAAANRDWFAVTLLAREAASDRIVVGIGAGGSAVSLDVRTGAEKGRQPHWFHQALASVRSTATGVIVSSTAQQSTLQLSGPAHPASHETHELRLPEPASPSFHVALTNDERAVVATDRHAVFVLPVDLNVFALQGEALLAHVRERLGARMLTQDEWARFTSLQRFPGR